MPSTHLTLKLSGFIDNSNGKTLNCSLEGAFQKVIGYNDVSDQEIICLPFTVTEIVESNGCHYNGYFRFDIPGQKPIKVGAIVSRIVSHSDGGSYIQLTYLESRAFEEGTFTYSPQRIADGLDDFDYFRNHLPKEMRQIVIGAIKSQPAGNLFHW